MRILLRLQGRFVLLLTGLLVAMAVGIFCLPCTLPVSPFQEALSTVGLSSAVSLDWSFFGFDPRLEPTCENELWPIPGLSCPNPSHGASVADYPPADALPRNLSNDPLAPPTPKPAPRRR